MNSPGGMNVGGVYYDVELNTASLIQDSRKADSALRGVEFRMGAVALAVKALAAALALIKMAQVADDMRLLSARVEVAAGSIERGAEAMNALARISVRTQTALADSVQVFTRLNSSIMQMGGTQQDTLRITELLAMAIKVSGASAGEAASAMTQFGQALGSGQLQGDELRSLLENAPYLMRQLADGIGVPVGALKKLGEEGKLTADVVTAALTKAAGQIETDFGRLPRTFEAAMMALVDQLRAASKAADDLSGTSSVLTGVATGTAEAVGMLADQLRAAAGEATNLGRNDAIGEWSRRTTLVLSYVADAADMTWQTLSVLGRNVAFVFQGVGREIGGIGAQIAAVMRGDLAQAAEIRDQMLADAAASRAELDAADARSLGRRQLAGQAMRERMGAMANTAGGYMDRSDRLAAGGQPSTLRAGAGDAGKGSKKSGESEAEIRARQDLARIARVDAAEEEADRKARDREEAAAADRRRAREQEAAATEELRRSESAALIRQTQAINPIEFLRQEYEAKLAIVQDYEGRMAAAGVDATEQGQLARTEITREYEAQRLALAEQSFRSQGEAQAFVIDSLNALNTTATNAVVGMLQGTKTIEDAFRSLGQTVLNEAVGAFVALGVQQIKNALLGDTIAAADKARAVASGTAYAASVGAQVAGMSALAAQNAFAATAAIPIIGPGLAPAAAAAAAATAASLGAPAVATAPLAGARQYGGPVSAGSMYRVNETGAPEMFVGSGGKQYMLPTQGGQVIPADEVGGGSGGWVININNAPPGTTATVNNEARIIEVAVGRAKTEIAGEFRENSGQVWGALSGSSNVRGRF